jgi:hypothetical protein
MAYTTPASIASAIKNFSTIYVRVSLSYSYYAVIALNFSVNWSVEVCAFHFFALRMYSVVSSPPTHEYLILLSAGGSWWPGFYWLDGFDVARGSVVFRSKSEVIDKCIQSKLV